MESKTSITSLRGEDAPQSAKLEKHKLEIHRLYIESKRTLKETMTEIHSVFGFEASEKSWKNKLKEWGFKKNIPCDAMNFVVSKEKERTGQGKDTVFRYKGIEITPQRIQNVKSRKSHPVVSLPCPATHPDITYSTPITSGFPHIKSINEWLFDEHRPWSTYDLYANRLNHDYEATTNYNFIFDKVKEIEMPFEDHNDMVELYEIGKQPFGSACLVRETEEQDIAFEVVALMDAFDLQVKLVQCLRHYEEHSPQALDIRFLLAKALDKIGAEDEAERHCRKILDKDSQISVQTYLGMILARSDRLEESTKWLFIALTGFVINFGTHSLEENKWLFNMISELFAVSIQHDWGSLWDCMTEMMATLRKPKSDADIPQICPQLFIHGFSFAQKCNLIGLNDSAKSLYEYLLEHSCAHFVNNSHAFEKAIAHQRYGLLLRKECNWASSAQQLLLACKSAMKSGSYDRRLVVLLANNFDDLRPHLAAVPNEADTLAKTIELMLAIMQYQNFTTKLDRVAHLGKYFDSHLPKHFATFEPCAISHQVAHLTLALSKTEISQDEEKQASTVGRNRNMARSLCKSAISSEVNSLSTSGDGSHPYGTTFPDDDEWFFM